MAKRLLTLGLVVGAASVIGLKLWHRLSPYQPSTFVDAQNVAQRNSESSVTDAGRLRVVTWNIKAFELSSFEAIADELLRHDADIIFLQEVDVGTERSEGLNQAKLLADKLGMSYGFVSNNSRHGGEFGVALLSRFPLAQIRRRELRHFFEFEPRAAIYAEIEIKGERVGLVSAHLDLFPWSLASNVRALESLSEKDTSDAMIVAGDFNLPKLWERFISINKLGEREPSVLEQVTFPGPTYRASIDKILSKGLQIEKAEVVQSAVGLSDHLPVVQEFVIQSVRRR